MVCGQITNWSERFVHELNQFVFVTPIERYGTLLPVVQLFLQFLVRRERSQSPLTQSPFRLLPSALSTNCQKPPSTALKVCGSLWPSMNFSSNRAKRVMNFASWLSSCPSLTTRMLDINLEQTIINIRGYWLKLEFFTVLQTLQSGSYQYILHAQGYMKLH